MFTVETKTTIKNIFEIMGDSFLPEYCHHIEKLPKANPQKELKENLPLKESPPKKVYYLKHDNT